MSKRKAMLRLFNISPYVIAIKLLTTVVRALVTLKRSELTGNFYQDWTRLQHWIEGRLIAIEFSKLGPLPIIEESQCSCWEELFYSKGWNSYARTKFKKIANAKVRARTYTDDGCSTEVSQLR